MPADPLRERGSAGIMVADRNTEEETKMAIVWISADGTWTHLDDPEAEPWEGSFGNDYDAGDDAR